MTNPTHDPCCSRCKTPWGVCATKRSCTHHQRAKNNEARREAVEGIEADLRRASTLSNRRNPFRTERNTPWNSEPSGPSSTNP